MCSENLIDRFWKIQESVMVSSNEIALYFFLVKECKVRGYPESFECTNRKIVLSLGISEPTLISCRNKLRDKGILNFESGARKKLPVYYLNGLSKTLSKPLSKKVSKRSSINSKAKEIFLAHFTSLFGESYYWAAKDSGGMSQIINKLKYQREQRQLPNEDEDILNALKVFLGTITDGWIYNNFSVSNINSKFNEIISNAKEKLNGKVSNKYEQKQIDSKQRQSESVANLSAIREEAERRKRELESNSTAKPISRSR